MPKRRSDELAAIDEVMPLVDQFNTLEHAQRLIFLDMVDPLPEDVAPTKKSQKKASKKSTKKSARASSLGAAVKSGLGQREPTTGGFADDADMLRCSDCGAVSDDNVHHKRTDPNFHPFVSTAPPAPSPSPANGGASSITQSSEVSAASAHAATGGSSE